MSEAENAEKRFFEFLNAWAEAQGCTFEIETFDVREADPPIDGMAAVDTWGWLIPKGVYPDDKDDYFGMVEWNTDENGHLFLQ